MARMYTVKFGGAVGSPGVAVTAVQDFFELSPAANKPIRIVRLKLAQSSDYGDAQDEGLDYSIFRVPATATSGDNASHTTATPQVVHATDQVAGFTCDINNTTVATTSGTLVELLADVFNVRSGLDLPFEPECRFEAINGTFLVVRLNVAPADSLTMHGTCWVEEEG